VDPFDEQLGGRLRLVSRTVDGAVEAALQFLVLVALGADG
jgi:hypothetical protein